MEWTEVNNAKFAFEGEEMIVKFSLAQDLGLSESGNRKRAQTGWVKLVGPNGQELRLNLVAVEKAAKLAQSY